MLLILDIYSISRVKNIKKEGKQWEKDIQLDR
jgi:hypothetical protein